MAGLGRGLGSLISESNNKKARQQDNKGTTLGQDLLARSRSAMQGTQDKANEQGKDSTQAMADSTLKDEFSQDLTSENLGASQELQESKAKKAPVKKTTTKKANSTRSTKAKVAEDSSALSQELNDSQDPTKDTELKDVKEQALESVKTLKRTSSRAKKKSEGDEVVAVKKSRAKKATTTKEPETNKTASNSKTPAKSDSEAPAKDKPKQEILAKSKAQAKNEPPATDESEVPAKGKSKSDSGAKIEGKRQVKDMPDTKSLLDQDGEQHKNSELSYIAKDVALAQSMRDAMELSYLADNGLNDKGQGNSTQELLVSASDDHLVLNIKLDMLMPSTYQPRHSFDDDAIRELATSIQEHGLLEPLIVKRIEGGLYEIICGERRYRAARMLNMAAVPCLVREVVDEKAYAIALIENIQRENLNPVELAIAFDQMMQECGMTQEEVAKSVCKSRSAVANYLRVLKLEDGSLAALKAGKIDLGHAKVLLSLSGSAQNEACQIVIERGLSVRATESFVKEFIKKIEARAAEEAEQNQSGNNADSPREINYLAYEKSLNTKLKGVKAKFKVNKDGKGKLTFSYSSESQLDSLLNLLGLLADK